MGAIAVVPTFADCAHLCLTSRATRQLYFHFNLVDGCSHLNLWSAGIEHATKMSSLSPSSFLQFKHSGWPKRFLPVAETSIRALIRVVFAKPQDLGCPLDCRS